jgi:hypothetical protein
MAAGLDDAAIFDEGSASPESAPPPAPEPLSPPSAESEAVSAAIKGLQNEGGRPTGPRAPSVPPPAAPPAAQEQALDPQGLLRGMLEERERRQDLQARLERFERQEHERAQQAQAQRTPLGQRLFEDPEATIQEIRQEILQQSIAPLEQRIVQMQIQQDMQVASLRHADVWQDAWSSWYQGVQGGQNAPLYFRVMNAPSPGEELVEWFREERVRREVGNDPVAYRERLREELLAEMGYGGQPAPPQRSEIPRGEDGRFAPRQPMRLPTPTSRMGSGAGARGNDESLDGSDDAIFAAARPSHHR